MGDGMVALMNKYDQLEIDRAVWLFLQPEPDRLAWMYADQIERLQASINRRNERRVATRTRES